MTWIIACGLKREADIFRKACPDLRIVAGGGDRARLERELDAMARVARVPLLSSGLAGALDPALRPGDVVLDGDAALVERLRGVFPRAFVGKVTGGDAIVATATEKGSLRVRTGAVAADMESHVAREVAQRHGLPFAAIRVISDAANETLPPAALVGMGADGDMALGPVLASLARHPGQLPALIRTGRHAGMAFAGLGRVYDALGRTGILRLDLLKLALDVA
ncbi:hypothetical protein [Novosphingobium nitrogenifigens]|uniref:phosphorylase family protein n=1 Tax=Novosphingobium nitrogenifigens TaxID=378548 RepID=UPI0003776DB5|nr:hypothetical protein [Novosphingobium nitrogenifigens]